MVDRSAELTADWMDAMSAAWTAAQLAVTWVGLMVASMAAWLVALLDDLSAVQLADVWVDWMAASLDY